MRIKQINESSWEASTEHTAIVVDFDGPCGPAVEYSEDLDCEDVEALLPHGWAVDWDSTSVEIGEGRYRSPLVREITYRVVCNDYTSPVYTSRADARADLRDWAREAEAAGEECEAHLQYLDRGRVYYREYV